MAADENLIAPSQFQGISRPVSGHIWLLAVMLSIATVGLNHDFDVVGVRIEETASSGAGMDEQAKFESDFTQAALRRKIGFFLLIAAGVLALAGPRPNVTYEFNVITLVAGATLLWVVGSLAWSDDRSETLIELIRLSGFVFTAVALARRCRINELVFIFLCISLVSIGVALAMDIGCGTFRPWSAEYRMGGSLHPNQLARIAAVAAMIANVALMQHRSRLIWLTVLAACLVVVWMTRSRSGMAGCAAGLIALQFIGISRRSLTFSGMVLLVALSLTGMFLATAPSSLQRQLEAALLMGRTDQAVSLTGRVPLWKEIWRDGSRRPWTGYGYGAYWITDRIDDIGAELRWYPRHSHSAYMEVLLDLGIVGATLVVLLALLSIAAYSRIAHVTGRLQYRLFGALFVSGLANGFFEVAFISPRFEGLFVGVAVAGLFVCHREAADSVSTVEDQRLYTDLGGRLCPT